MLMLCFDFTNCVSCKFTDDLVAEKEKNKLLQEEMEVTLHDIQNM